MYDFIGIYQEMIYFGVFGVVGITMIVQSKFWNKNKRNVTIQYPVKYILIFRQNRENKISVSSSF